eukprot:1141715-Rhodomonas_salina.1
MADQVRIRLSIDVLCASCVRADAFARAWQMWMSMDELDHAVNDPRVSHLMDNFLRFLTPTNANPVNRVLAKLAAAV